MASLARCKLGAKYHLLQPGGWLADMPPMLVDRAALHVAKLV